MLRLSRLALCLQLALLASACAEEDLPETDDGILGVAITQPGFQFYPPWGPAILAPQTWAPEAFPRLTVRVEEVGSRVMRTFSATSQPPIIRHEPAQAYGMRWDTYQETFTDGATYRVVVLLDGVELGRSDLGPIYVPKLRQRRDLWIKFRVERAAVDRDLDGVLNWQDECPDGAHPATAEVCNGIDDDCDGEIDEGPSVGQALACDDGNACTRNDVCSAGTCSGSAITCTASDACHVAGVCDPTNGACTHPPAPNGTICDDGNACTLADYCSSGACGGAPVQCASTDACHAAGVCDPSTGMCSNPNAVDGTTCSDNNSCTAYDSCLSGTCSGVADDACNSCINSYALQFDGANDHVNAGDRAALHLTSSLTIEAWIYPTGTGDATWGGIIVNNEGRYEIARMADGRLGFALSNTSPGWIWTSSGSVVPLNRWTHVAFVYDRTAGVARFYQNGALDWSYAATGPVGDFHLTDNQTHIGGRQSGSQFFNGRIDEVRIWNFARSQADIQNTQSRVIPAAPGLVGNWRFDEGAGTVAQDRTANASHASVVNGPTWTTLAAPLGTSCPSCQDGVQNGTETGVDCGGSCSACLTTTPAIAFDGVNDYVRIGDRALLHLGSSITIEAWVYATGAGSGPAGQGGIIVNDEGRYEVARFSNGHLAMAIANSSPGWAWIESTGSIPLNTWTHVAVVYDQAGAQLRFYINGVLDSSRAGSGAIGDAATAQNEVWIGGRQSASSHFAGRIDEVRIWNTARTQAQLSTNRDVQIAGGSAGLVGYWRFNENAGTTTVDQTANGNTGTLVNGPTWSTGPVLRP